MGTTRAFTLGTFGCKHKKSIAATKIQGCHHICDFHPKNQPFQRCGKKQCEQLNPNKKQKNRSNKPSPDAKSVTPPNAKSASTKKSQFAVFLPPKKTRGSGFKYFCMFIPTSGT